MRHDNKPVYDAITSRRAIRAFLPKPVDEELVKEVLQVAARAPSGTNMQPWKVLVVTGDALNRISQKLLTAHADPNFPREQSYKYYPDPIPEPYLSRRRKLGWDLYSLLGIKKGDVEKMHSQHGRNLNFFGAPVGLIFTIDEKLEIGSWLDYGMFLQSIMIAARANGLDTCPQAAFAPYHKIIRPELSIPDSEVVICGMALGYADMDAVENLLKTEREPVSGFARFAFR